MQKIAHAILLVDGKYVLQLRDNNPQIAVPGMWSLFGGSIEEKALNKIKNISIFTRQISLGYGEVTSCERLRM
jgi:hypothetical protein